MSVNRNVTVPAGSSPSMDGPGAPAGSSSVTSRPLRRGVGFERSAVLPRPTAASSSPSLSSNPFPGWLRPVEQRPLEDGPALLGEEPRELSVDRPMPRHAGQGLLHDETRSEEHTSELQ